MGWSLMPFFLFRTLLQPFRTLLQPKTTHFSGIFSALRPRWRSEQLKSGFYVTNHTRPILFRRILHLGNGFSNLDFSAIWKFHRKFHFWPKTKIFSPFCSAWHNDSTEQKKNLEVVGTLILRTRVDIGYVPIRVESYFSMLNLKRIRH